MNANHVFIVGRVTANPELRSTPGGQSVARLGVATNRAWTDKSGQKQEEAEFHNVAAFGRQAEIASQYLVKGSTVLVEGRLRTRKWTDKNGVDRWTTEIICERLELGPKPAGEKVEKPDAKDSIYAVPERPVCLEEDINVGDIPF